MSSTVEKPLLRNVLIVAIITHVFLAMTNIAMVATGIFMPRYLNTPDLQISDVEIIAELHELSLDGAAQKDVLKYYPNNSLFAGSNNLHNCSNQFTDNHISPKCITVIKNALSYGKISAEDFIHEQEAEIQNLNALRKDKAPLKNLYQIYSGQDQNIIGSLLIAENFIEDNKRESFLGFIFESQIRNTERKVDAHEDAIKAIDKALIDINSKTSGQSSIENFILSVTYHNSGHADSLITPHAIIDIANHEVPMLATSYISEHSNSVNFKEEYSIIEKNSYKNVLYIIDRDRALPKSQDLLYQSMQSRTPIPISFSTRSSNTLVEFATHLDFVEKSLLDGSLSSLN